MSRDCNECGGHWSHCDCAEKSLAAQRQALAAHRAEPDGLVERLDALHVWPQSVADTYADVLTPRQIEKLYEVGKVATEAAAELARLRAEVERLRGEPVTYKRGYGPGDGVAALEPRP